VYDDPGALQGGWVRGEIQPVPSWPAQLGIRLDPSMGQLAPQVGAKPALYRGLRPEALALLVYLGRSVRDVSGVRAPLQLTSTVRDRRYQDRLLAVEPQATSAYSLHTTGFAFDVRRRYATPGQAAAFQFLLDRLQALDVIAWVREPAAIHVTVGPAAAGLVSRELRAAPGT
jgi:hypothetical protein